MTIVKRTERTLARQDHFATARVIWNLFRRKEISARKRDEMLTAMREQLR